MKLSFRMTQEACLRERNCKRERAEGVQSSWAAFPGVPRRGDGSSSGWNCGGRGRHVCFVEAAGMTHTAEGFLALERARALAQCLEDGAVTLRSQLHVLLRLKRRGACPRGPQVSSPCPVSPAWAAYPPGTIKGRGCCCMSASSMFCRRTGEWAACGPRRPGACRAPCARALRRLLSAFCPRQEQWPQWAACLAGFQTVDCFLDLAWLLALHSTPKHSLYLWGPELVLGSSRVSHTVCVALRNLR